ncbi:MAG: hypothetical protein R3C62_24590 [Chloroflexota bacterium]
MSNLPPHDNGHEQELASIRAILLAQEREELLRLQAEKEALAQQLATLRQELLRLEQRVQEDEELLIARVTRQIDHILAERNREAGHEVAEAMGPVMAEAVEVQIREDRDQMIQALNPIIIPTIGRFVRESLRELRENIEAQLRNLSGRRDVTGDAAIVQALPFHVREMFLIQRDSGLLLAHYQADGQEEDEDSDLISGMLTAIRDFVRDSFGEGLEDGELDAIQYGEQRVVIRGGTAVYLAMVITGYEPPGTNTHLSQFVSELHLQHGRAFRQYSGDPATLPPLQPQLANLSRELTELPPPASPQPAPLIQTGRFTGLWVLLGLILLLLGGAYYLVLGYKLYPVVFGLQTATPTMTATAVSPSPTPFPTATPVPTATPSPTTTPLPTATVTPLPTATPLPSSTPLPTATSEPAFTLRLIAPVWVRAVPDNDALEEWVVGTETAVEPVAFFGDWVQITWMDSNNSRQQGWVPMRWVNIQGTIPAPIVTPVRSN